MCVTEKMFGGQKTVTFIRELRRLKEKLPQTNSLGFAFYSFVNSLLISQNDGL
jgi:hypothetical protein